MTRKKTSSILDKSLQELSIQVSLSGLSFCIRDTATDRITHLVHREFDEPSNAERLVEALDDLLREEDLDEAEFREVRVIHDNELSAFVPKALFNESNLSDYLKYNVKLLETDFIGFDELKSHEIFNVYIPFTNVNNYVFDRYGSFEYKHASTVLTESLLSQFGSGNHKRAFVQVGRNSFDMLVIANNKLLMHNSFPYQTREDFIYYVLFVYEQLDLNREETPLFLMGAIEKGDPLYDMAYTYIRNVEMGSRGAARQTAKHLEQPADHKDFILLNSF